MRDVIEAALKAADVDYDEPRPGAFLAKLPGKHKLATMTWLIAGERVLHIEAFFCRRPDENHAEFYRWLLAKNGAMYGVHFSVDSVGDVYLVGRLPLTAITEHEIDRLLGCVLTYSDASFDRALEIGFATSSRREWGWRKKRGEPLANLQAFARFAGPERA